MATRGARPSDGVAPARTPKGLPRRFGRNVGTNYVAEATSVLVTLIVTPVLIHELGTDGYGVWVLMGTVIAYLELFELGFGVATIKLVAEHAGRDTQAVSRVLSSSIAALAGFGAVALLVAAVAAPFVPDAFDIPADLRQGAVWSFMLLAVSLAISIPADAIGGALAGHQRYDLLSMSNLLMSVASVLGGGIVVLLGGGLVALAVWTAGVQIVMQAVRWRMLKRLVPGIRVSPRLLDRRTVRLTAGMSGWFLLRDLANVVINRIDLVVVGVFFGVRQVAIYSVALKLAQLGRKAIVPLVQVFFPHASAAASSGRRDLLGELFVDGTRIAVVVAAPIAIVLSVLARPLVLAWVGPSFEGAVTPLVLLAVARGLMAVSDTSWWLLAGAGWIRITALVAAVESVVNFGASVALARPLGITGVALGTVLGVVVASTPGAIVLAQRRTGVPYPRFAREAIIPHLVPTAITVTVAFATRPWWESSRVLAVVGAAVVGLTYLGSYLTLGPAEDRGLLLGSRLQGPIEPPGPLVLPPGTAIEVGVCIATCARPEGLRALLNAVAAQRESLRRLEAERQIRVGLRVIVVDNAGGLARPVVDEVCADLPWPVVYDEEPVPGFSAVRNRSVRHAAGCDLVAFVDDDEVPEPDWMARLLASRLDTGADVVTGPVLADYDDGIPDWVRRGAFHQRQRFPDATPLHFARTSNVLVRLDAVETLGDQPFDLRYGATGGEDTHLFMRLAQTGHSIVWADHALVSERVPVERATLRWLLGREYRRGCILSRCLRDVDRSALRLTRRVAAGVSDVLSGFALLLTALVDGRAGLVRGGRRICFGAGLVTGLSGAVAGVETTARVDA